ncbi:putative redox protein, regulator of disulfide bond formation [Mizugakiibacter sediminis]|uniref:OsmC family protein n=1 Tax=Mizugakiibacter sediminis TaxID=1475481 RepID=A0A0K8QLU5_9GAMM|nr:OsmC family protein [Mizugakiibacter sediminis]GAP65412.1 putative redox protein, regulator of disulfide bond formation [Mizugakiibacter sediminis]
MSEHHIRTVWSRGGGPFERGNYSRDHDVHFEGGQIVRNSAAAGAYGGNPDASNPEELLLAALSSCHMLTFLAVAANRGYVIDHYEDAAVAYLDKNAEGKMAVVRAVLAPRVGFGGDRRPGAEDYAKMHERAHAACFIANSVKTAVELRL